MVEQVEGWFKLQELTLDNKARNNLIGQRRKQVKGTPKNLKMLEKEESK